jgi:hypothetical protein
MLFCSTQDLINNVMQNNIRKTQNAQIPSKEGRAAEANTSINTLLDSFFNETTFDETEDYFSDLVQAFICPDPNVNFTPSYTANTLNAVRRVSTLLRKLEALNNHVKGGAPC